MAQRPICSRVSDETSAERVWRFVNYICNQPVSSKIAGTAEAMLVELTQVTRNNLRNVEGSLWALWAATQQINARQKVELSIRCDFPR